MIYSFPTLSIKFHVSAQNSFDSLEVYEIKIYADGNAVKPHFHQHTEEFFYVISGSLLFYANGNEFVLKQGGSFLVKRNVAHGFRAVDGDYAIVLCSCRNEGRMEKYVSKMKSLLINHEIDPEKWKALTLLYDQQRLENTHEYIDDK